MFFEKEFNLISVRFRSPLLVRVIEQKSALIQIRAHFIFTYDNFDLYVGILDREHDEYESRILQKSRDIQPIEVRWK